MLKQRISYVPLEKMDLEMRKDTEGQGDKLFEAVCKLGLEGIVSKRLTSPYRSGLSRGWIKVRNPKASAAVRIIDGCF